MRPRDGLLAGSRSQRARSGDSLGRRLAAPAKLRAVKPHAVQHHGELAGERHLGFLHALASGDAHRPGLEARPARRAGEHDVGRLVQRRTRRSIANFADPTRTIDLAGLVLRGVRPKWAPTALECWKRSGWSIADLKVIATTAPTPGTVISRRHTWSSRTAASRVRCRTAYSPRRTACIRNTGSTTRSSIAWPAARSRMRLSNRSLLIVPTFSPKPRRMPRRLVSRSHSLVSSSRRAVSRARISWATSVFTCTGRNHPRRISWAMPRASFLSVFTVIAL